MHGVSQAPSALTPPLSVDRAGPSVFGVWFLPSFPSSWSRSSAYHSGEGVVHTDSGFPPAFNGLVHTDSGFPPAFNGVVPAGTGFTLVFNGVLTADLVSRPRLQEKLVQHHRCISQW